MTEDTVRETGKVAIFDGHNDVVMPRPVGDASRLPTLIEALRARGLR